MVMRSVPRRMILPSKNVIARASKGRVFPVTVPEAIALIHELPFAAPAIRKRVDVQFLNPRGKSEFGLWLAAFYPQAEIVICSLPDESNAAQARAVLRLALRHFSSIDKRTQPRYERGQSTCFRAYLGPLNRLTITERTRRASLQKYRGSAKFSNAFKPSKVRTDERVVHQSNP